MKLLATFLLVLVSPSLPVFASETDADTNEIAGHEKATKEIEPALYQAVGISYRCNFDHLFKFIIK